VKIGRLAKSLESHPPGIGLSGDIPEAWLNSAAVLELDPEIRAQMKNFKATFQKC
jgi:hypothetical protein